MRKTTVSLYTEFTFIHCLESRLSCPAQNIYLSISTTGNLCVTVSPPENRRFLRLRPV